MEYDFYVVYLVGLVNMDVDALNCNPNPSQVDSTGLNGIKRRDMTCCMYDTALII